MTYLDYNYDSTPDATVPFGAPTDTALAGDVNGDGITDLVLFRGGVWYASTHQDGVVDATFYFGATRRPFRSLPTSTATARADLIVFRNGTWYVSTQRNGVADKVFHFGQAGDIPLVGRLQRRRHRRPRAVPQRHSGTSTPTATATPT